MVCMCSLFGETKAGQMKNREPFVLVIVGVVWLLAVGVQPGWAIMAGDETGSPADSPADRVIDNSDTSNPFAGVGSIEAYTDVYRRGSGTPLSRWHVLTAAHLFDGDNNGVMNGDAEDVTFSLSYGSWYSSEHTGLSVVLHPDFTGIGNPNLNDDLAIITLSTPIPEGVPIYNTWGSVLSTGTTLDLVGYGKSGYGDVGDTVGIGGATKRWGQNEIGAKEADDELSGSDEIWEADFDGPSGNGYYIGTTLGNDVEGGLAEGDSGGPAFYYNPGDEEYYVGGTGTYVFTTGYGTAPLFGSGMGGMLIYPYLGWIDSVLGTTIELPGDVNGDMWIGGADLTTIISNWGMTDATREQGDLSGDGTVSGLDYTEVVSNWGNGVFPGPGEPGEPIAAVPEAGTVWVVVLAGIVLARRGRKQ